MTKARERILQSLRHNRPDFGQHRSHRTPESPHWAPEPRAQRFKAMLESVRAEVHVVGDSSWTGLLQRLVRDKGLKNLLCPSRGWVGDAVRTDWAEPGLPPLFTDTRPLEDWKSILFFDLDAAVTSARAGIAETGTLVLWPDADEPRTWSLVPPIHFVVLDQAKLYDTFAEAMARERWQEGMPTNALLISGPSKSADIEQTLAYGVHGPVELVVLLVRRAPRD